MLKKFFYFVFFLISSFYTQAQVYNTAYQTVVNQTLQANITEDLTQFEALGVKRRGTPALQNTLDWLKTKYLSYGYTASQLQEFSYTYSGSAAICKNLVVTKIGTLYPNTFLIVCGHYDSISGTGTNDNGSGVASILETARLLQNIPTEYSIKFINFSGEEDGLKGSQNYVTSVVNSTSPKMSIRLVFNLDEVGGVAGMINNNITCERDESIPTTNNAASNTFTNELINCVGLYTSLNTTLSYAYASDYMSFQSNNEIITGFFETNETTHKHTTTDLLINMDPVYNYKVAMATVGATLHFAKASSSTLEQTNFNNNFQVTIFPNPTSEKLYINTGNLPEGEFNLSLIDSNGKRVLKKTISNNKQLIEENIENFAKGIYIGVLQSDRESVNFKFIIQ